MKRHLYPFHLPLSTRLQSPPRAGQSWEIVRTLSRTTWRLCDRTQRDSDSVSGTPACQATCSSRVDRPSSASQRILMLSECRF